MNEKIKLIADTRWKIAFEDPSHWRLGIYKPEFHNSDNITTLEKHSCPELFICVEGKTGLLIEKNGKEEVINLNPQESILIDCFHNGFSIDPKGYFIVVEQTDFTTEYKER